MTDRTPPPPMEVQTDKLQEYKLRAAGYVDMPGPNGSTARSVILSLHDIETGDQVVYEYNGYKIPLVIRCEAIVLPGLIALPTGNGIVH